jgi:WD40 repeat protein
LISPNEEKGKVIVTTISINDEENKINSIILKTHENEINNFCLNINGNILATSDEKGILIKIWFFIFFNKRNTNDGSLIKVFKRGKSESKIYSMSISNDNNYLISSSDRGTIHIFNLNQNLQNSSSIFSYFYSSNIDDIQTVSFFKFQYDPSPNLVFFSSDFHFIFINHFGDFKKIKFFENGKYEIIHEFNLFSKN